MNVSIITSTWNKEECLPNTLTSVTWQKTNHNLEWCIVDDGSIIDPHPLLVKYCGNILLRYKRLPHVGFKFAQFNALDLISPNTEAIILQSCDTLYASPNLIQDMIDSLKPGIAVLPNVRSIPVQPDLFCHPEKLEYYLSDDRLKDDWTHVYPDDFLSTGEPLFFQGNNANLDNWLFFLGAILLDDLLNRTCWKSDCSDVIVSNSMHESGMQVQYIDGMGIHQRHAYVNPYL
jgi:glycosyltransferase involved in cell wall biosynthesis